MNEFGGGLKARMWFMAAVLVALTAGCGSRDEIFGASGGAGGAGGAGVGPSLGAATGLAGLGGGSAGMTNTGIQTQINNGDIGTIATATSSITGFHDSNGDFYTEVVGTNEGAVSGRIFTCALSSAGPTSGTVNAASCALATQARLDAEAAYNALVAKPTTAVAVANLSGLTLAPGVYTFASTVLIQNGTVDPAGDLTLDGQGNANALWVFQVGTALTVGGPGAAFPRSVKCINGCQPKNVFWAVGSFATINAGGGGTMVGNIISSAGASFSTAALTTIVTLEGRVLSLVGPVTLNDTVINVPAP